MKIVILSDTHGLLRPRVVEYLKTADVILHAGDINKPDIGSNCGNTHLFMLCGAIMTRNGPRHSRTT